MLKQSFLDLAPDSFATWLDRNVALHDPIFRGWRMRGSLSPSSRSFASFKCSDDQCMHFIYGFTSHRERDAHASEHGAPPRRDSSLFASNPFPLQSADLPSSHSFDPDYLRRRSSMQLPKPNTTIQLAALTTTQPRDRRDSLLSYSLGAEHPPRSRGSIDSEVDPLLPPLKRNRAGQSRLESIEELKLGRGESACLRCRVLRKSVWPGDGVHPCVAANM